MTEGLLYDFLPVIPSEASVSQTVNDMIIFFNNFADKQDIAV